MHCDELWGSGVGTGQELTLVGHRSRVRTGCTDIEVVPFPERALEVTCIDLRGVLSPQSLG